MSGIATRWVVSHEYAVDSWTVDDSLVERWVTVACDAYLELCPTVRDSGLVVRRRLGVLPSGAQLGGPSGVLVTASATEVRPSSFTIAIRLRPGGGATDIPINATCTVELADADTGEVRELGADVRDELIALEHSARYFN